MWTTKRDAERNRKRDFRYQKHSLVPSRHIHSATCSSSSLQLSIQFGLLNQQHCCQVVMASDCWVSCHAPHHSRASLRACSRSHGPVTFTLATTRGWQRRGSRREVGGVVSPQVRAMESGVSYVYAFFWCSYKCGDTSTVMFYYQT